jgi:hypothetical protein
VADLVGGWLECHRHIHSRRTTITIGSSVSAVSD